MTAAYEREIERSSSALRRVTKKDQKVGSRVGARHRSLFKSDLGAISGTDRSSRAIWTTTAVCGEGFERDRNGDDGVGKLYRR